MSKKVKLSKKTLKKIAKLGIDASAIIVETVNTKPPRPPKEFRKFWKQFGVKF